MISLSKIAAYAAWIGIAAAAAGPAGAQGYRFGPNAESCACDSQPNYSFEAPGYDRQVPRGGPGNDAFVFDPYAQQFPGQDAFSDQRPGYAAGGDNPFNEAYSFADEPDTIAPSAPGYQPTLPADPGGQAALDEATLLIGTWAWQGEVEGMHARIQTAFYPDGTYESYAETPVLDLYETGYWALIDGLLVAEVTDYAPRFIDTPYGREAVPMESQYQTYLTFIDEDTVETDIGLSYRID